MKKNILVIIFVIAIVLWTIGAVLLYKKDSPNTAIIVTGVILIIGFVSQILKKVKNDHFLSDR